MEKKTKGQLKRASKERQEARLKVTEDERVKASVAKERYLRTQMSGPEVSPFESKRGAIEKLMERKVKSKSTRMDKLETVVGGLVVGLDKSIKENRGEVADDIFSRLRKEVKTEKLLLTEIERLEKKEAELSEKMKKEGKKPTLETGMQLVELSFEQKEAYQARSYNLMQMVNKFANALI